MWLERDHRKSQSTISIKWEFLFAPKLEAASVGLSLESYGRRRPSNGSMSNKEKV